MILGYQKRRISRKAAVVRKRYQEGGPYYNPQMPRIPWKKERLYIANATKEREARNAEALFNAALVGGAGALSALILRRPAVRGAISSAYAKLRRNTPIELSRRGVRAPIVLADEVSKAADDLGRGLVKQTARSSGRGVERGAGWAISKVEERLKLSINDLSINDRMVKSLLRAHERLGGSPEFRSQYKKLRFARQMTIDNYLQNSGELHQNIPAMTKFRRISPSDADSIRLGPSGPLGRAHIDLESSGLDPRTPYNRSRVARDVVRNMSPVAADRAKLHAQHTFNKANDWRSAYRKFGKSKTRADVYQKLRPTNEELRRLGEFSYLFPDEYASLVRQYGFDPLLTGKSFSGF